MSPLVGALLIIYPFWHRPYLQSTPLVTYLYPLNLFTLSCLWHNLSPVFSSPWHSTSLHGCGHSLSHTSSNQGQSWVFPLVDFIYVPLPLPHLSKFHEALFFLESCFPFWRHQHSFQKGDSILTLITFTMRNLRRHRGNHHFSLMSSKPITFDFNKISCYGGSYYATIAVILY